MMLKLTNEEKNMNSKHISEKNYLVTDKITISIEKNEKIESAFKNNLNYICNETLSNELVFSSSINNDYEKISLVDNIICNVLIDKQ